MVGNINMVCSKQVSSICAMPHVKRWQRMRVCGTQRAYHWLGGAVEDDDLRPEPYDVELKLTLLRYQVRWPINRRKIQKKIQAFDLRRWTLRLPTFALEVCPERFRKGSIELVDPL